MRRLLRTGLVLAVLGTPGRAFVTGWEGLAANAAIGLVSTVVQGAVSTILWSTDTVGSVFSASDFVERNADQIAMDLSRGEGEYLDALADLMEVPAEAREDWYEALQAEWLAQSDPVSEPGLGLAFLK